MTRDEYIAGQKASGIEVRDEVRVMRKAESHEDGWDNSWTNDMDKCVGEIFIVESVDSREVYFQDVFEGFPYFVLQIVKKAAGTVPNAVNNTKAGDSNMKTQNIYSYVVTENINDKDAKTGQIEKVTKKILGSGTIAAYDTENAKVKALSGVDLTGGIDEVEVLVRPFCG